MEFFFATSLQHILAELERIDLLVRVQVWRARQVQAIDQQFQGFYLSGEARWRRSWPSLLACPLSDRLWPIWPLLRTLHMSDVASTTT